MQCSRAPYICMEHAVRGDDTAVKREIDYMAGSDCPGDSRHIIANTHA